MAAQLAPPVWPGYKLPNPLISDPLALPNPFMDLPEADLPSFKPMYVGPGQLEPPEGVTSEEEDANANKPQPKKVEIPFTNYKMPVPEEEIMITAATTAAISVAATLTATSLFKQCVKVFKPIFMQLAKRIQKKFTKDGDPKKESSG